MSKPTIHSIRHQLGVAGQYSITATVEYPGERRSDVTFVGNAHGGPIVMVTESGAQTLVSREVTDRIGSHLEQSWVRRFFA